MRKNKILITVVFLFYTANSQLLLGDSKKAKPLRDGFALEAADGKLAFDGKNKWFFRFDSDIKDDRGLIKAGTNVELLFSSALEKMIPDVNNNSVSGYRLWASITKYKDKNFIFPIYSLPIGGEKQSVEPTPNKTSSKPPINEPNDELSIPEEVVAKLKARKVVKLEQLSKGFKLKQDHILADRTGFITQQKDGSFIFTLDALGLSIQNTSIQLLPCQTLQKAVENQMAELEPLRTKVAGIVTQFKGENYLLLQRAKRVYSHGNFGR